MTTSSEGASAAHTRRGQRLKNMGLFLVSPFVGLYYAVVLPGKLIQLARAEFQASSTSQKTAERP